MSSEVQDRISALRQKLSALGLGAWVSLTSDPHASEYVPAHWAERKWLSGFSGSAGTLVVTEKEAKLWTDSRYWVQASKQLEGSGIELMRDGGAGVPSWHEWLAANLPRGSRAGICGATAPVKLRETLAPAFAERGIGIIWSLDPVSEIWTDRPAVPAGKVFCAERAPDSASSKLSRIREEIGKKGCTHFITSALDETGWITNLRGSDVPYNPVFLSHVMVSGTAAALYAQEGAVSEEIRGKLASSGIELKPYGDFEADLGRLPCSASVFLDPATTSVRVRDAVPAGVSVAEGMSPAAILKTRKSKAEIALLEEAMLEDGAALCRFYAWLEKAIASHERITELDVVRRLHEERAKGKGYVSESFGTIAAVGANAALPHYEPSEECNAVLEGDTVLLIDSGAQYQSGTTDITRVTPVHRPAEAICRDYTAVLRAHINLLDAYFPEGAYASQLDTFARAPLWEVDADYGHGTGHGVGFFMNVHERPYSISPRSLPQEGTRTVEGVVVSDEPGVYREGRWGIRIESLVTPEFRAQSEFGRFLGFRALTLCPIDTRMIVARMMKSNEIAILNNYHKFVREKLKDRVTGEARDWLFARTEIF